MYYCKITGIYNVGQLFNHYLMLILMDIIYQKLETVQYSIFIMYEIIYNEICLIFILQSVYYEADEATKKMFLNLKGK